MYNRDIMLKCFTKANHTMSIGVGGPFGSAITKNGELICVESNSVLFSKDCTCHAEMNAIRKACEILRTYDLSDCELYATGYPCPMCLGAIMWSRIKTIYVSGTLEDAKKIGFNDEFFYETLDNLQKMCYSTNIINLEFHEETLAQTLYKKYQEQNKTIY